MKLRDWLLPKVMDSNPKLAISATPAIYESLNQPSIARIATIAGEGDKKLKIDSSTQSKRSITLEELINLHPAVVEGCRLVDILAYAHSSDYEELKDPLVLVSFAKSLHLFGQIKVVDTNK